MHILIIDDHSLFRTGLRVLLKQRLVAPVVLEANSAQEALACQAQALDLILLDIQMQGLDGLQSIGLLHQKWPATPVVVLSSSLNPQDTDRALASGAVAFLSKADTDKKIVQIISQYMKLKTLSANGESSKDVGAAPLPSLTARQTEVLGLICDGLSNKAIARRLDVSEFTVRGHVQAVFALLQVTSRTQAVAVARRLGWFE